MYKNYKIILVGDTNRGKTTFVCNNIDKEYKRTIGVDVSNIEFKINDLNILFNVWDTSGDEKNKGLDDAYYINASGAILFYSTENEKNKYIKKIKRINPEMNIILVYSHINNNKKPPKEKLYPSCELNMMEKKNMILPYMLMCYKLLPQHQDEIVKQLHNYVN